MASGPRGRLPGRFVGACRSGRVGAEPSPSNAPRVFGLGQSTAHTRDGRNDGGAGHGQQRGRRAATATRTRFHSG
jgi:hypothetical protein